MNNTLILVSLLLLTSVGTAQQMMRLDARNALVLSEVGAVISFENEKLSVQIVPPADRRPPGMDKIDIEQGDVIGMINGKRVSTIADLREAYEKTPVGSEVKIGLRRGDRPHIITFTKKDAKGQPQGMQIVRRDDHNENEDVFPALGIAIGGENNRVSITETFPNVAADLKKGDVIVSLNGKAVKVVRDFSAEFDGTEIGADLTIELLRDGKKVSVKTPRPKPAGVMMRNRN